jgi:hypothetical protein
LPGNFTGKGTFRFEVNVLRTQFDFGSPDYFSDCVKRSKGRAKGNFDRWKIRFITDDFGCQSPRGFGRGEHFPVAGNKTGAFHNLAGVCLPGLGLIKSLCIRESRYAGKNFSF